MPDGSVVPQMAAREVTGKSLLFPVTPQPGETLLGYLTRCLAKNHLGVPVQFMRFVAVDLSIKGDFLGRLQAQIPAVQEALHLSDEELAQLWGVADRGPGGCRQLGGVWLRPNLIEQCTRRVPPSITADQADNALWMVKHLSFCSKTWEILVDACPNRWCGKHLTWPRAQSLDRCRHCGTYVSRWPAQKVPNQYRDVLAWLIDLFSDCVHVRGAAMRQISPALDINTETEVYELVVALKHVMKLVRLERGEASRQDDGVSAHVDLAAAARFILDYPRSIWDAEQNRRPGQRSGLLGLMNRVGRDTTVLSVRQAIREITRLDIPNRMHPGARRAPPGTMTARDAAKELGVPPGDIKRLVEANVLRPLHSSGRDRRLHVFDGCEIEKIALSLTSRMSWRRFSGESRVPADAIEQLILLGLLKPFSHPVAEVLYGDRHLEEDMALAFIERLRALPMAHAGTWMTLKAAMEGVGGREKPWAPVLLAGLKKHLPGGLARSDPMGSLENLLINPLTAQSLIMGGPNAAPMFSFDAAMFGAARRAWMGPGEVQNFLNCSAVDKAWLLERGHIAAYSDCDARVFDRETIERFGQTWMTSREAARRLGADPRGLWRTLERYDLRYDLGHGFHLRDELEPVLRIEAASQWRSQVYGEGADERSIQR